MSDQKHVEVGPKLNIKTGPDRIVKIKRETSVAGIEHALYA
jgi:hypothetical protein